MVARERRISSMGNQGVPQTNHERTWMLPNQSDDLVDEQTSQTGRGRFEQNLAGIFVSA